MNQTPLEFWFDFASTYSYVGASRIEALCRQAFVPLRWRPFLLGAVLQLQNLKTSPVIANDRRERYTWRDMERLTAKYNLPWNRPSAFPRNSTLACRIAASFEDEPWIAQFIRAAFTAFFRDDLDLNDAAVISALLCEIGVDPHPVLEGATSGERRGNLRSNTEEAIRRGIFGAPNCFVGEELFWGEEALEDAVEWARQSALAAMRSSTS